jgi:hypothetical protein
MSRQLVYGLTAGLFDAGSSASIFITDYWVLEFKFFLPHFLKTDTKLESMHAQPK